MPWWEDHSSLFHTQRRSWKWLEGDGTAGVPTPTRISAEDFEKELEAGYICAGVIHPAPVGKALAGGLHAFGAAEVSVPRRYADYEYVFSPELAHELPPHGPEDHAIELEGGQPPWGPIYNLSVEELRVLREYIADNLEKGFIQPSTSPAGAPVLFIKKKDGRLRLCVDYRGLNKVTIRNRYPLPLIGEALDRLVGAKIYTKLDLRDAYYRIRIREGDEWKTAFRTRYGHFEYRVMPFGLANAPATFQAHVNNVLREYLDVFCIVYLDDILIFSDDEESHERHVRQVLEKLGRHRLYAKLEKCTFHTRVVDFVGFVISPDGVSMEAERVSTIADWPPPTTHRDVQVFLGFANFYRRFIWKYSQTARPLTDLLKGTPDAEGKSKRRPFEFDARAQAAFNELKTAFTTAPILRHFDPDLPIRLETDSSGFALAGILSQPKLKADGVTAGITPDTGTTGRRQPAHAAGPLRVEADPAFPAYSDALVAESEDASENAGPSPQIRWHPVAYWSRKMVDAERNYATGEQELLAIVMACKQWRHYLEGAKYPVRVLTDHNNLRHFLSTQPLSGRKARWWELLSGYHLSIDYRPGPQNPADGPSRRPDYERESRLALAVIAATPALPTATRAAADGDSAYELTPPRSLRRLILDLQAVDPLAQETLAACRAKGANESGDTRRGDPSAKPAWRVLGDYLSFGRAGMERVYVPPGEGARGEILLRHHDDPLAGHFGHKRTLELIQRKYYWPRMQSEVKSYVKACRLCQQIKAPRRKPHGELQPLPPPKRPWSDITMDFITDLPPSLYRGKAYDALLVVMDRYTKMARYVPTRKTLKAHELAEVLADDVFLRDGGVPETIVSDRGTVFTARFWSSLCYHLKIRHNKSTAFHPQTDGQTERQNQTVEQYLRSYVNYEQDDWARWLRLAEFSYNNSCHATTGVSPFFAWTGTNGRLDVEEDDLPDTVPNVPAAKDRAEGLKMMRRDLEVRYRSAVVTQAKYYNRKRSPITLSVGDKVLLSAKNIRTLRPCKKLDLKYYGPYEITEAIGKQAYRLQLDEKVGRIHPVFHVSLLQPFYGDVSEPPPVLETDQAYDSDIADILDSRFDETGELFYLVKWAGLPDDEDDTWVRAKDGYTDVLADEFHAHYPDKPAPPRRGKRKRRKTTKD